MKSKKDKIIDVLIGVAMVALLMFGFYKALLGIPTHATSVFWGV